MRNKYLVLSLVVLYFLPVDLSAQSLIANNYKTDPALISMPTPQAAALGNFGRIPVDIYNGLFDLSIPVYHLPVKGHNIDINLSYHSGGIKPNEKGGVVGVGWSLIASGTITRIQNGTLDEHVNTFYTDTALGYYFNRSQLNRPDWSVPIVVDSFVKSIPCEGSPPGCPVTKQWHDWAPDEFTFNFLGYSGSFWLDNNGNWQIRESSGEKMTVSVNFGAYVYQYPGVQSMNLANQFQKFTITDGEGNVFVFGGDGNSIEYNRNLSTANSATATSWHLTQVNTSKGEKISFLYQRIFPSATEFGALNSYSVNYNSNYYFSWELQHLSGILHDPVYLQQITFNQLAVQFKYMPSTVKSYCCNPLRPRIPTDTVPTSDISGYIGSIGALTEPSNEGITPKPIDYQLDTILISYGNFSKIFTLNYYTGTNRLFLQSVTEGSTLKPAPQVHQFLYNGTSFYISSDSLWLVQDGILTTKIDHWGFYNGKFPFKTGDLPRISTSYALSGNNNTTSTYFPPTDDFINNYITTRQPIYDSTLVGSLSRVIYPTGGYTDFVYELNDYSSQLSPVSDSAIFNGHNSTAGGLRIKQVISHANALSAPTTKQYRYIGDNGYSSGVLNSAGVLYKDSLASHDSSGNPFIFKYFYDNNQMPLLNPNGNPVTYSRVDEVNSDSGRIIHRFFNHDNGHNDQIPWYYESTMANGNYYKQSSSLNFQRGKEYSARMYDSAGNGVSQTSKTYIKDDSLTSNHIGLRSYGLKSKDIKMMSYMTGNGGLFPAIFQNAFFWSYSVSAYVNYLHNYPVIKSTDTLYNSTAFVATADTFAYDTSNNKVSTHTVSNLSDGSSKTEKFSYPPDLASGNTFYTAMVSQHIIDPVIKTVVSNQTGKLLLTVQDSLMKNIFTTGNLYLLYRRQKYQVATDIRNIFILKYDSLGNPVNTLDIDSIPVAYKWDYSSIYPIAAVKNAWDSTTAYTSFEADGTGNWTVPDATRNVVSSMTGTQGYDLTSSKTISDVVPSGKQYIVSFWLKTGGGGVVVKSNSTPVSASLNGLTKNGFSYYEYLLPSTTTSVAVTGASVTIATIDELRLHPVDAQMTTYTYAPLMGVTSVCSPSNNITYYTYDASGRLYLIKDMDQNIIKEYSYQYQVLVIPVYNTIQGSNFFRTNCGAGYVGGMVTYNVAAGTYASYISQADANQQALNDVATNGPAYANLHGTCYVQLKSNNYVPVSGFNAAYTPVGGGGTYNVTISSSTGLQNLGVIPPGNYNLTISKSGNSTQYTFGSGCGAMATSGTSATFSNITVSVTNCNTVSIDNVH